MEPQLIEVEELAEEQVTGGRESAEEVLTEDDDLVLRGRGHRFVPWDSSFDAGWKKTGQPVCLQLLRRDRGSSPIGGDRSLRRGRCGGGGGLGGDVDHPAGRGALGLGGTSGALVSHGVRAEREGSAMRERDERGREREFWGERDK